MNTQIIKGEKYLDNVKSQISYSNLNLKVRTKANKRILFAILIVLNGSKWF